MKFYLILLVFIMLIDQSMYGNTNLTEDIEISQKIYQLDDKIDELKFIIKKINYANHILEFANVITYEKLQDLKNIKDINLLIESHDKYRSSDSCSNDSIIKDKINYPGRYPYSKVLQSLIEYTRTTIYQIEKKKKKHSEIDIFNNTKIDNSTLNNIKLENERLVFCSKILEIYSKLKEKIDIDNDFYFSKNINFIFEEIYNVGLQILNYKKDQEKIVNSCYNNYGDYSNIFNLLNSYLEKRLNF